ncbi:MAG: AI-2E family transporter [Polyangia bacterium]
MRSRFFPLPLDPRWRRLFGVALFLCLLYGFRHLTVLFVCFVLISRGLGKLASVIEDRLHVRRMRVLGSILAMFAAVTTVVVLVLVRTLAPLVREASGDWRGWFEALQNHPALEKLRDLTGVSGAGLVEQAKHHALDAVHVADATAHVLLYVLIGLIVAVMYSFEREELVHWRDGLYRGGIVDVLVRWFGYVSDAIVATARMQLVVAIVNTVVTLPILLLLGLKHVAMLSLLIIVSGLIPVVGNLVAGAVLCLVAYESRGAWAVGVFVASTFVLHKIESYYLNPRLAAEHVHLPALVLVGSLILFEHVFGLAGLFLSFPALYVGSRIRNEWLREVAEEDIVGGGLPAGA